jgi:F0F1-type ATP synthase assembly protein I
MLGGNIVASLAIGVGAGIVIDNKYKTSPLYTLIGLGVSLLVVGLHLYKFAKVANMEAKKSNDTK